jgi:uncharacterized membrane protein
MGIFPILMYVSTIQILTGLVFSLAVASISHRFKTISFSGALGMVVVGTLIFGFGGVIFAAPLIFFFISSSIFTRIKSTGKDKTLGPLAKQVREIFFKFWLMVALGQLLS